MLKKRNLYCYKCGETAPHQYVGRESKFEGMGIARAVLAVSSFGMSETTWADKHWQCEHCGTIRKY